MKLGKMADTSEVCAVIQRDLNKVEKWADRKRMKSGKEKSCTWGGKISCTGTWLVLEKQCWKAAWQKKAVLVDNKPNKSQQCANDKKKANGILACTRRRVVIKMRELILPLCSAPVKPHL